MALLSVQEFADKYDLIRTNVYLYNRRGKIVFKGKKIDTNDPLNKLFIETREASKQKPKVEISTSKKVKVKKEKATKIIEKKTKKGKSGETKEDTASSNQYAAAVNNLNKLKTEKLIEEIEMAKLKKQKMTGEIIPVSFTQNIFNIHFKNVSTAFYNAVDNYTAIIIERLGGNRADLSLFRLKLNEIINEAIKEAKEKSKQDLIALSKEYSESND